MTASGCGGGTGILRGLPERPGIRGILELFAERRCLACFHPLGGTEGAAFFCNLCAERLRRRVHARCPHCGEPADPAIAAPVPCGGCLASPPPWRRFFLYGDYSGLLRDLILRLKTGGELPLARALGLLLAPCVETADADTLLVPMPLHPARLRERGFNQALELARPLAGGTVRLAADALIRTRDNPPQRGLSRSERKRNIRGIFSAAAAAHGQTVLLLDDVLTTGATLREAARALQKAGAAAVDVAVLARTPGT